MEVPKSCPVVLAPPLEGLCPCLALGNRALPGVAEQGSQHSHTVLISGQRLFAMLDNVTQAQVQSSAQERRGRHVPQSKIPSRGKPKGLLKLVGGPLNLGHWERNVLQKKLGFPEVKEGPHTRQNRPEISGGCPSPSLPSSWDCIWENTLGQ